MLKDVGMHMTVQKSRKTSIYAVTQGIRACNNNNMGNLNLKGCREGYVCYYCYILLKGSIYVGMALTYLLISYSLKHPNVTILDTYLSL